MLSIGELAAATGVSVRMLRHYDALGLLVPERVDPTSGHRGYAASQVGRVNGIVVLKELGFTLAQCHTLLADGVSVDELRGLLSDRHRELAARVEADTRRLAEVRRRLRSIHRGLTMSEDTLRLQPLPALRVAQLSAEVNDTSEIATMVRTLTARLAPTEPSVRTYDGRATKITVAVGVPLPEGAEPPAGLHVAEFPAEPRATVVTHHRDAADTDDPWRTVDVALAARGLASYGVYRQIGTGNVVELQCPVRGRGTVSASSDTG